MITDDGSVEVREPKHTLQENETLFVEIYSSKSLFPESDSLKFFFQSEKLKKLNREKADTFERLLSVEECAKTLKILK